YVMACLKKVFRAKAQRPQRNLCFFRCTFASLREVILETRVARELALVTSRRSHSDTELSWSLATPTTRLNVRLRGPCKLQNVSQSLIRVVDVFICDERLLSSET